MESLRDCPTSNPNGEELRTWKRRVMATRRKFGLGVCRCKYIHIINYALFGVSGIEARRNTPLVVIIFARRSGTYIRHYG